MISKLLLVAFLAQQSANHHQTQPTALAVIGPAPPVQLLNQNSRPVDLAQKRGKTILVSFVYTSCSGTCPATTSRLVQLQNALQKQNPASSNVEFLSITLDPAQDTPPVLKNYAVLQGADLRSWHFLTGDPDSVAAVWRAWDMWARKDPQGAIDHPSRIFLIDAEGRIREIYSVETLNIQQCIADIRSLQP
jgi:protein SCO1/2